MAFIVQQFIKIRCQDFAFVSRTFYYDLVFFTAIHFFQTCSQFFTALLFSFVFVLVIFHEVKTFLTACSRIVATLGKEISLLHMILP